MMIVPLSGKVSWKNPPVMTIALIVINCLIYFIIQANDKEYNSRAYEYYFKSGLARIEVGAYIVHEGLDKKDPELIGKDGQLKNDIDEERLGYYAFKMLRDDRFVFALDHERIITLDDQRYRQWKLLRTEFKNKKSLIVSEKYGFKPAEWTPVTAFTHMFLHGSFDHLLGNMVFLWLVGCVLELGCGRVLYLATYLIGGFSAVATFTVFSLLSLQSLIGASGAISALIGAYLVLYGRRKIKVFYSLGIYFDYAMVPAIVILPIWIGNEVLQFFLNKFSSVAYMAHAGGLVGGAMIGFMNLSLIKKVDTTVFDEDPKSRIPGLMEEAMYSLEKLDSSQARLKLQEILAVDPNHHTALMQLYHVEKLHPKDSQYDDAAICLMDHLSRDRTKTQELLRVYREYLSLSAHPRMGLDLLLRVGAAFIAGGIFEEAEKITILLRKKHPESKQLPRMILALAKAYMDRGDKEKAKQSIRLIIDDFPSSREASAAQSLIQDMAFS